MSKIVFKQPTVMAHITNKEPYVHEFVGFNHSDKVVEITKVERGCSCTSLDYPRFIQPESEFKVTMVVDKTYVQEDGFYSTNATMIFSNNETHKVHLNGKLSTS